MSLPAELDPGSEPGAIDPDPDPAAHPEARPDDMTHSERVVALAEQEQAAAEPVAASLPTTAEPETSPWIYDVMDDDEPDVAHPPAGSAE